MTQVETPVEVEEEAPRAGPPQPQAPPREPPDPWPAWFDDMPRD